MDVKNVSIVRVGQATMEHGANPEWTVAQFLESAGVEANGIIYAEGPNGREVVSLNANVNGYDKLLISPMVKGGI